MYWLNKIKYLVTWLCQNASKTMSHHENIKEKFAVTIWCRYIWRKTILPWALSPYQSLEVCFKILVSFTCDILRHLLYIWYTPQLRIFFPANFKFIFGCFCSLNFSFFLVFYVVLLCSHFTNLGMQNLKQIALEYSTVLAWALSQ